METPEQRHDDFWLGRKAWAEERLGALFADASDSIEDVIGKDLPDCEHDVRELLAYVLRNGSSRDSACAIISATRWVQACDELHEHK